MNPVKIITLFIALHTTIYCIGQDVYKTPSGKKYHLSTCRMVENVSKKLTLIEDIKAYNLTPCSICKPPLFSSLTNCITNSNKAAGESKSVQCNGFTLKGTRCQHRTKIANGYCYQHQPKNRNIK